MKIFSSFFRGIALLALTALSACGGGGDDGGNPAAPATHPSSGPYGWILKASGPTAALKYGLSLVHPTRPASEYAIEAPSGVVTDVRLVSSGTVDMAQLRVGSLQPSYLVYVVGGDVRSVPLQADGSAPASRVQRAQSTSACRFVVDAIDYAAPQSSRFMVTTAGADGQCGSADDGRAEVRLSATLGVVVTPFAGEVPFDVVRDPVTLAPRGWLSSRSVSLWSTTPSTTFATRSPTAPAVTSVVTSTYNAALVDDGTRLAVLGFTGGVSVNEVVLNPAITAGGGWLLVGYDAGDFYVYRNSGRAFNSTYTVLKIARATPNVSVLASGTGLVSLSAMGKDVLYLTVFGAAENRFVRIAKLGGVPVESSFATTTFVSIQTSASGVHQVWRVTGVGGATPGYLIDIVDELGNSLYSAPGGFPLNVTDSSTRDFNTSESRTGFLLASGYGARAFGDASLISYDAAARVAKSMGALPGTALFGNDFVFASATGGPTSQGLAFAARSSNGSVQESGAKVFSFDLNAAGSLTATTDVR